MKWAMWLQAAVAIAVVLGIGLVGFNRVAMADEHEHSHDGPGSFPLFSLVKPLGICAISSLLITFLIGLFRRKLGRRFLKVHMIFAFLTIIIALSHGILVLLLF